MSRKRYFGTDGVRGPAGQGKLSAPALVRLGRALGLYYKSQNPKASRAVLGQDPRFSSDMFSAALSAGLMNEGIMCEHLGALPTAAISYLTQRRGADLGLMITASHNPFTDNGVKLFGPDGRKLTEEEQAGIEKIYFAGDNAPLAPPMAASMGVAKRIRSGHKLYKDAVINSFDKGLSLKGLKIVIDCANGAGFKTGPEILRALGAEDLVVIGNKPNGRNINLNCGSTHSAVLQARVLAEGADIGIALDGDADRLILADEQGRAVDGDQILALLASSWQDQGRLSRPGIAATQMSNLGLDRYLKSRQLDLVRTDVGDRHVAAAMKAGGYNLGGEQSGHVLMPDYLPTGDGMAAAVQVLAALVRARRPASETLSVFTPLPQLLKNVRYEGASPLNKPEVKSAIDQANARLAGGRILVRASGTEPVIRIMAEGEDEDAVGKIVGALVDVISKA